MRLPGPLSPSQGGGGGRPRAGWHRSQGSPRPAQLVRGVARGRRGRGGSEKNCRRLHVLSGRCWCGASCSSTSIERLLAKSGCENK
jgi:hypothetical protein